MPNKYMKKMLNITHYQRNTNQKYNEVSSRTGHSGHHQNKQTNKQTTNINGAEDVQKRESHCTTTDEQS